MNARPRALGNLRGVLHGLRQHLDPYVSISREVVAAKTDHIWLDANELDNALAPLTDPAQSITPVAVVTAAQALALYEGEFLLGFPAGDSRGFEDWLSLERRRLHRRMREALSKMAKYHLHQADYAAGLPLARRLVQLEPFLEHAHRKLMRLLALDGQSQASLAHYETFRQLLQDELGVEPEAQTRALFDQIHAGQLAPPEPPKTGALEVKPQLPAFLETGQELFQPPPFVARESELKRLETALNGALAGQGRPLFVAGEAGAGKTALLEAFARRAQERHPELLVAHGICNIQSGLGNPYLPFRQVLTMLAGDVEGHWAAGRISSLHAARLWHAMPEMARALLDHGPDLIENFLPTSPFLARLAAMEPAPADLVATLSKRAGRSNEIASAQERGRFFEQVLGTLQSLAARQPVLCILDDLQWVDTASTNLLFHLCQNLGGSRILLLGAYRPDEIALGRPSGVSGVHERHPMKKALDEFRRTHGDVVISLDVGDHKTGQAFVNAFLDTEPNRLDRPFRELLASHTRGHPLFTVELLRAMQERGAIKQDDTGHWIEAPPLDWDTLPARVEGVIEERIGRLQDELRDILTIASVEGDDFTAQVVARVQEVDERGLARQLSRELVKRHRLVGERGTQRVGNQRLYLYRFRHSLFRNHIYSGLGQIEREMLHLHIGEVLEDLFGDRAAEIAPQLAWHFSEARETGKAIAYSLLAGDQARLLYAHREAIQHYDRALALQKSTGNYERAGRSLMKLGLTYHNAFMFRRARRAYAEGFDLWQKEGVVRKRIALAAAPHALRMDWRISPRTLDPAHAIDNPSAGVIDQLFSGLVELSPSMDVVPDVAARWEILDGGRRYLFHLRHDVLWSDGVPVTAHDFEIAWKRGLSPATGSQGAQLLYDVRGARDYNRGREPDHKRIGLKVRDDHTLEVELESPTSYFLQLLSYSTTYPVPGHIVKVHAADWSNPENLVSNGPFFLKSWQPEEFITLKRNPDYHRPASGNLEEVELFFVAEPASRFDMYTADELDILILWGFPGTDLTRILQQHAGEYFSGPYLNTSYMFLNIEQPPFNDVWLRRALAHALDREALADIVMGGSEFPATGGLVPPGMPGHVPGIALQYDPARAQALLAEAGFPQGKGLQPLSALSPQGLDSVAMHIFSEWEKNLNVQIDHQIKDWREMFTRAHEDPSHIMLLGWAADYPDPDNFLRVSRAAGGWRAWRHEAYDQYVRKARGITDQHERLALYRKAERILVDQAPVIPLTYGRRQMLVKPWVRKLPASAIRFWYWKDVVIEPH